MKIVFCHNVYDRIDTLYHTIGIEKMFFPESQSVVGYNYIDPTEKLISFPNLECIKFNGISHKIGCSNGFISTVKASLKYNPDVVIFSHDDVYINWMYISTIKRHIDEILNSNYDVVCRKTPDHSVIGGKYYMMEAIILSKKAVELCFSNLSEFKNEQQIDRDIRGSISPEVFLYNRLNVENIKINAIDYDNAAPIEEYNRLLGENLGFYHINIGYRGWNDKDGITNSWKQY